MLNEVLNAGCNRAFGPGRREWTGRGGPFMWCTFSFGWSEGEAAAGTEEGRRTFSKRSGVGRSLNDHLWSGFSTCGRALDTWGLTVFACSHCWPWLCRGCGGFPCRSCLEKWHRRHPPQTISPGTTGGFATGRTVTTVTMVTTATMWATCQQVSADAAAVVLNSHVFLNLHEEKLFYTFFSYCCFPISSIWLFPWTAAEFLSL